MTHNNDELRFQIQCHVDQQDARICAPHRIADLNVCVLLAHWEVTDDHAQVINIFIKIDHGLGLEVLPNVSVTCMDENGGSRSVGETWEVYGLSCSCSPTGEVDCDMSGFDYASYFGF